VVDLQDLAGDVDVPWMSALELLTQVGDKNSKAFQDEFFL
jgi:hypothetical protein